jgi:hypothetical protein
MERGFFGRSTMLPVVGRVGEDRGEARSLGVCRLFGRSESLWCVGSGSQMGSLDSG